MKFREKALFVSVGLTFLGLFGGAAQDELIWLFIVAYPVAFFLLILNSVKGRSG